MPCLRHGALSVAALGLPVGLTDNARGRAMPGFVLM